MVVGRLSSFWEGNFSGAMLNFRGVHVLDILSYQFAYLGTLMKRQNRTIEWQERRRIVRKVIFKGFNLHILSAAKFLSVLQILSNSFKGTYIEMGGSCI